MAWVEAREDLAVGERRARDALAADARVEPWSAAASREQPARMLDRDETDPLFIGAQGAVLRRAMCANA